MNAYGRSWFATLSILAALAAMSGCGGSEETVQFDPPATPSGEADQAAEPPPQKPVKLLPIDEVVLQPGETTTVEIKVERDGQEGPIQLALSGLPGGIKAPQAEIPAGQNSLKVELPVPLEVGQVSGDGSDMAVPMEEPMPAEGALAEAPSEAPAGAEEGSTGEEVSGPAIRLTATFNGATSQRSIKYKLLDPKPPEFRQIAALTLKPGASKEIEVSVDRKGFKGPIALAVAGLPDKVTAKGPKSATSAAGDMPAAAPGEPALPGEAPAEPAVAPGEPGMPPGDAADPMSSETSAGEGALGSVVTIPADATSAKLVLAAAADAKDGTAEVKVVSTVRGKKIETPFALLVESFAVRLGSLPVVTLKPGEKKTIDVPVVRRSYKGALSLQPTNLPEKVKVAALEIPADATTAKLEVAAEADAPEQVRSAYLASAAKELELKEALVVRVSKGEGGFLPAEVTVDPEMMRLLRRGSFGGRLEVASKQALLKAYGGTAESEAAVLRGLKWLASQQNEDGSWSLAGKGQAVGGQPGGEAGLDAPGGADAQARAPEQAAEAAPGEQPGGAGGVEGSSGPDQVQEAGVAGTAFGLLPFLGAGITHEQSPKEPAELKEYRKIVFEGLKWLGRNQVASNDPKTRGQLPGGMYAHALGTLALCEAYGMSQDERLKPSAQQALRYLTESQHEAGGWRYSPRQPGDTSVTGWVFLAIRSGQLAGLPTDRTALARAGKFLDSCGSGPEGAKLSRYSYQPDGKPTVALTAAGLLTRQYLGWEQDNPDLLDGCKYLMQNLPPEGSAGGARVPLYYYYYATQVLHHMEGEDWDKWNHRMREHLLALQERSGQHEGSFAPQNTDWGTRGGRMYSTSLALMTLETYYRHLPMYRKATRPTAK